LEEELPKIGNLHFCDIRPLNYKQLTRRCSACDSIKHCERNRMDRRRSNAEIVKNKQVIISDFHPRWCKMERKKNTRTQTITQTASIKFKKEKIKHDGRAATPPPSPSSPSSLSSPSSSGAE